MVEKVILGDRVIPTLRTGKRGTSRSHDDVLYYFITEYYELTFE